MVAGRRHEPVSMSNRDAARAAWHVQAYAETELSSQIKIAMEHFKLAQQSQFIVDHAEARIQRQYTTLEARLMTDLKARIISLARADRS